MDKCFMETVTKWAKVFWRHCTAYWICAWALLGESIFVIYDRCLSTYKTHLTAVHVSLTHRIPLLSLELLLTLFEYILCGIGRTIVAPCIVETFAICKQAGSIPQVIATQAISAALGSSLALRVIIS